MNPGGRDTKDENRGTQEGQRSDNVSEREDVERLSESQAALLEN